MMKGNSRSPPLPRYARYALLLPVPHLFVDLHRLAAGRAIDAAVSQPDLGSSSSPLTLNQWEEM